jgi:hypothetical protein
MDKGQEPHLSMCVRFNHPSNHEVWYLFVIRLYDF